LKFKHIRSREAINRQMMMKFNDILAQYCKEVTDKPLGEGTPGK
jgi:dynein heavy chain